MKKPLLFPVLLVLPALTFLFAICPEPKQTAVTFKEVFRCTATDRETGGENTWAGKEESKTGRLLTYLWEEQPETQNQL